MMRRDKFEISEIKQRIVNFIRENPGADGRAIVDAIGGSKDSMMHLLRNLAAAGYIMQEKEPIPLHGGTRGTWWYLRDYDKVLTAPPNHRAVKARRIKKNAVPEIFKLYQPPMPVAPRNAKRVPNTEPDRPPLTHQGGQGAVRRSSWARDSSTDAVLSI